LNTLKTLYKRAPHNLPQLHHCDEESPTKELLFSPYKIPIGIEVEVENSGRAELRSGNYWEIKEDGSLRNNGAELVSCPVSGFNIDAALLELERFFAAMPKREWSIRTSIHVHVNVSDFSTEKLHRLVAMYAALEDVFFGYVAPERRGNPYCYPLCSLKVYNIVEINANMKYCAFNLAPIETQLSVEFRHLHGTDNMLTIKRWIMLILRLFTFINKNEAKVQETIENLLYKENRTSIIYNVFGAAVTLPSSMEETKRNCVWALFYLTNSKKDEM
jgi:hypothetical protein